MECSCQVNPFVLIKIDMERAAVHRLECLPCAWWAAELLARLRGSLGKLPLRTAVLERFDLAAGRNGASTLQLAKLRFSPAYPVCCLLNAVVPVCA